MSDLNEAVQRFKEDLESGFYESRKDEYRRLFPDEWFGVDEGE